MDDTTGTAAPDVEWLRALAEAPYRYSFYNAIRRLECLNTDKPRLGESVRPADEPVRLGQEPFVAFAPATLAAVEPGRDGRPPRLETRFFGLFGPNGALPLHLTEYARERLRNANDPTFARFADVFHHRMLSLFYRAWAASQPAVNFDRPDSDRFGAYVASLFGLGMPSLRDRDAMPDVAKLHYAGHLACLSRHPDGLRDIISDFFKLPVRIVEFVGEWLGLAHEHRCRLSETRETGTLGLNAILGARVWERHHKFRIVIGPVGFSDYQRLLPGGDSLRTLRAVVRNDVGEEFVWDMNLVLKKEEVPALELGRIGQLGWTTWLASEAFDKDADDLVLEVEAWAWRLEHAGGGRRGQHRKDAHTR